ncbi:MAG: hypothetical protein V3W44_10955 [Dehalococcoidales bacterium]
MAMYWGSDQDGLLWEPDFSAYEDTFMALWRELIPGEGTLWSQVATKSSGKMLKINVSKSRTVTIYIRSAMNRQTVMRSEGLTTIGWVAIDEPARMLMGQKAFSNSLGRARNPMQGWHHNPIFMVGSPLGLGHWTAETMGCTTDHPKMGYHQCYEPDPLEHPGYVIRACRTSDNASNLSDDYEYKYRLGVSRELADQEMNASLTFASGMVLPEWQTPVHVLPHEHVLEMWERRIQRPIGGVDWGYHTCANEVLGWTKDRELLLIDETYAHGMTDIDQGVEAWKLTQEYATRERANGDKAMPWYCDPENRGGREQWKKGFRDLDGKFYVVGAVKANNAWQAGIDRLRHQLSIRPGLDHPAFPRGNRLGRPGMFVSDRCQGFIAEAPAYRHLAKEEGKPLKDGYASADPLCDDHAIDSARYACFTTATTLPTRSYGRKVA